MVLLGATRVLEQRMCEWKPSEFFKTMYATVSYADSEASQNIFAKNATRNNQDIQITERIEKN